MGAGLATAVELSGRGNSDGSETVLKPGTVPEVSPGCPRDMGCAPPAALPCTPHWLLHHGEVRNPRREIHPAAASLCRNLSSFPPLGFA